MILVIFAQGCNKCPPAFEPRICYTPPQGVISSLPTPFAPLSRDELQTLWGKELYLGTRFAEEGDSYRAITAFKSSLYLLPKRAFERKEQIEFYLFLSYYFACKYKEAREVYEESTLNPIPDHFPAKRELRLALWECYDKTFQCEKAEMIRQALDVEDQSDLTLSLALQEGDICTLNEFADREAVSDLLWEYRQEMKSVKKAETLQTILPGAGYWYVGLHKAAVTSFIINTLFIAAAAEFFHHGYYAASLITLSLETGWYFGGINGAGLAANEYNERLYEGFAKDTLLQEKLFPVLKFEFAF